MRPGRTTIKFVLSILGIFFFLQTDVQAQSASTILPQATAPCTENLDELGKKGIRSLRIEHLNDRFKRMVATYQMDEKGRLVDYKLDFSSEKHSRTEHSTYLFEEDRLTRISNSMSGSERKVDTLVWEENRLVAVYDLANSGKGSVYEYDSRDSLVYAKEMLSRDHVLSETWFEYGLNGKLWRDSLVVQGKPSRTRIYSYDKYGRLIRQKERFYPDHDYRDTQLQYDKNGRLVKSRMNSGGGKDIDIRIRYNDAGQEIFSSIRRKTDSGTEKYKSYNIEKKLYGPKGRILKLVDIDKVEEKTELWIFTWSNEGRKKDWEYFVNNNKTAAESGFDEYDQEGLLIKEFYIDDRGETTVTYQYSR